MKANELRGRDREDLLREYNRIKRQLFDLRFQWQSEDERDCNERRALRRDAARIKTVLREMELAEQGGK